MRDFKILFLALVAIILNSCASTNRLTLSVKEPAPVLIPENVTKIGLINRSIPSENNVLNDIDKLFSLEGKELDKLASNRTLKGVFDELSIHNVFSEVMIIDDHDFKTQGLGIYPASIPWEDIEELCLENNVDAIFSLSFFDTNTRLKYEIDTVRVANAIGVKIPVLEHKAILTTDISVGWRIYDPASRLILDEFIMPNRVSVIGKGLNPIEAAKAIIGRKEAVLDISNKMGHSYSNRIFPYVVRRSRDYFVRGTTNFEVAKRRAQTGDWNGAAILWEKEVNNPKSKIAGRACYNMAIINEINGDLHNAVKWASKAYTDYNIKLALRYVNVLKNRIERNKLLN